MEAVQIVLQIPVQRNELHFKLTEKESQQSGFLCHGVDMTANRVSIFNGVIRVKTVNIFEFEFQSAPIHGTVNDVSPAVL